MWGWKLKRGKGSNMNSSGLLTHQASSTSLSQSKAIIDLRSRFSIASLIFLPEWLINWIDRWANGNILYCDRWIPVDYVGGIFYEAFPGRHTTMVGEDRHVARAVVSKDQPRLEWGVGHRIIIALTSFTNPAELCSLSQVHFAVVLLIWMPNSASLEEHIWLCLSALSTQC